MDQWTEMILKHKLFNDEHMNRADWDFNFVSRKLYMIITNYSDTDIHKFLPEAVLEDGFKCGFKAFMILNQECEPVTLNTLTNAHGQGLSHW